MKENNNNSRTMGDSFSPYKDKQNDNMSKWYALYEKDNKKYLYLQGKKFCKIIYRCNWYADNQVTHLVTFENIEDLYQNDILVDENGHEFVVKSFQTISFNELIPEWYLKTYSLAVLGNDYSMGEYITKK